LTFTSFFFSLPCISQSPDSKRLFCSVSVLTGSQLALDMSMSSPLCLVRFWVFLYIFSLTVVIYLIKNGLLQCYPVCCALCVHRYEVGSLAFLGFLCTPVIEINRNVDGPTFFLLLQQIALFIFHSSSMWRQPFGP